MGKGKGKKDKDKAKAKKEAKAASQASKAAKREKKNRKKELAMEGEEDIETILAELAAKEAAKTAVVVREASQPSARANFSMLRHNDEMVVFGGEYYDGAVNTCFNDVFWYHLEKGTWREAVSPMSPIPRCSHQACVYLDHMYVFAGELATARQFYHHRDMWKLNLTTCQWTQVATKTGPSARSGHRMLVWRHYIVLFGGFYESVRDHRWFGDLYLFDLRTDKWAKQEFPGTAMLPAARSGHALVHVTGTDTVLLYGGYSEVKVPGQPPKGMVHTDMWALHLEPVAAGKLPRWERVRQTGDKPSKRTGFAMTTYKDRVVLFGGVSDTDTKDELESRFHNDLYAFDYKRRRWLTLGLKDAKSDERRRRRTRKPATGAGAEADPSRDAAASSSDDEDGSEEEDNEGDAGADLYDENAFYYYEDGVLKRVVVEEEDAPAEEPAVEEPAMEGSGEVAPPAVPEPAVEAAEEPTLDIAAPPPPEAAVPPPAATGDEEAPPDLVPATAEDGAAAGAGGVPRPEVAVPCGRMKPMCFISGNLMYIYGGLVEVKSKEVTLDDLWCIDLRTRTGWTQALAGTVNTRAWHGDDAEEEEEEEEDAEAGAGASDEEDEEDEDGDEEESKVAADVYAMSLRERQKRIKLLRDSNGLADTDHTPNPAEKLSAFFKRTVEVWVKDVAVTLAPGDQIQGKDLRRKAFLMARERYDAVWPVLEELGELETQQAELESGGRRGVAKGPKSAKEVRQAKRAAKQLVAAAEAE